MTGDLPPTGTISKGFGTTQLRGANGARLIFSVPLESGAVSISIKAKTFLMVSICSGEAYMNLNASLSPIVLCVMELDYVSRCVMLVMVPLKLLRMTLNCIKINIDIYIYTRRH